MIIKLRKCNEIRDLLIVTRTQGQSNQEALVCNKMEIDVKERGLEPSGPRPADKVAWVVCGCVIVT